MIPAPSPIHKPILNGRNVSCATFTWRSQAFSQGSRWPRDAAWPSSSTTRLPGSPSTSDPYKPWYADAKADIWWPHTANGPDSAAASGNSGQPVWCCQHYPTTSRRSQVLHWPWTSRVLNLFMTGPKILELTNWYKQYLWFNSERLVVKPVLTLALKTGTLDRRRTTE